jgi:hypothetical protein
MLFRFRITNIFKMEEIYLSNNLKKKYMHDFLENVLHYNKDNIWKLDAGLDEILISVNRNPNIQSLYSRKDSFSQADFLHESYIELCYSRYLELLLFREVIPSFNYDFIKDSQSLFYYQFNYPRQNPNYSPGSETAGMGCIDDENYFQINTIRLILESPIKSIHEKFWIRVRNSLSVLTPGTRSTGKAHQYC